MRLFANVALAAAALNTGCASTAADQVPVVASALGVRVPLDSLTSRRDSMPSPIWTVDITALALAGGAMWRGGTVSVAAIGITTVVVLDQLNSQLLLLSKSNGRPIGVLAGFGQGDDELDEASAVSFHREQYYVADSRNHRISVFGEDGQHVGNRSVRETFQVLTSAGDRLYLLSQTGSVTRVYSYERCCDSLSSSAITLERANAASFPPTELIHFADDRFGLVIGDGLEIYSRDGSAQRRLSFQSSGALLAPAATSLPTLALDATKVAADGRHLILGARGDAISCYDATTGLVSRRWYRSTHPTFSGFVVGVSADLVLLYSQFYHRLSAYRLLCP